MGRRSRRDGELTRERILQVALPLFAQNGYAGTSTRMVGQAAGVNVATLAYYFEGKRGLYLAVVQRLHQDLMASAPQTVPALPPQELIPWVADFAWAFACEHNVHIRLLIRNVLDAGQHEDVILQRWSEPLLLRAEAIVAMFRPNWSSVRRRLLVLSMMHVLARFAVEDREQLRQMAGDPEDLDAEIRGWIAEMIALQLGVKT